MRVVNCCEEEMLCGTVIILCAGFNHRLLCQTGGAIRLGKYGASRRIIRLRLTLRAVAKATLSSLVLASATSEFARTEEL